MIAGPLDTLRASRRLAARTTACPDWCDHQHDLTGDDRGINHGCALISPDEGGPVEAYLRCRESVNDPGVLGAVSVAIFTTERDASAGAGWFVEIPVDGNISGIQRAVACAMMLVKTSASGRPTNRELDDAVRELVDTSTAANLMAAT